MISFLDARLFLSPFFPVYALSCRHDSSDPALRSMNVCIHKHKTGTEKERQKKFNSTFALTSLLLLLSLCVYILGIISSGAARERLPAPRTEEESPRRVQSPRHMKSNKPKQRIAPRVLSGEFRQFPCSFSFLSLSRRSAYLPR